MNEVYGFKPWEMGRLTAAELAAIAESEAEKRAANNG